MSKPAFIITGPTSGYGLATARELARHGTVVLVGRDRGKLDTVRAELGPDAVSVVADLSELASVRRAADELRGLGRPYAALIANAGVAGTRASNARGWDLAFATNHLGTIALIEALAPALPAGANVVVVASAVEDPERKPARAAGFRGGRFVSVEASARGEWQAGGATRPGLDAYATSKQCVLAATLALAREDARLRYNAVEPGFSVSTGLARDANLAVRVLAKLLFPLLRPLVPGATTPRRAGRFLGRVALDPTSTGVYFDERGAPMTPSVRARDPRFQDQVLAETRAFLARN